MMDKKKNSTMMSPEKIYFQNARLKIPETSFQKDLPSPLISSARTVTLPDVLNSSRGSFFGNKPTRPQGKSIAVPGGSLTNVMKIDTGINFNSSTSIPKYSRLEPDFIQTKSPGKRDNHEKKVFFWKHVNDLKSRLDKYIVSAEEAPVTLKSDLSKIFKFLRLFEEFDPNLDGMMEMIIKALDHSISTNSRMIDLFFSQEMRSSNEELEKLYMLHQQKSAPYYVLCSDLAQAFAHKNTEIKKRELQHREIVKELEDKIEAQNKVIQEFHLKFKETVPIPLYEGTLFQIDLMKQECERYAEKNDALQTRNQELSDECTNLKQLYEQEKNEVETYKQKIEDLQKEKGTVQNEANMTKQNIQIIQKRVKGLKDIMDQLIVRLSLIKNEVSELREQNQELEMENDKLHIRAARGFDALTPRPDYKQLQEEEKIDLEIFTGNGKKQKLSTVDIVNELLTKNQNLQDKLKDKPKKKVEPRKLSLTRKDSTSDFSANEGTPKPNKILFKRSPSGISALKLTIYTNMNNNKGMDRSNNNTPRSASSKLGSKNSSRKGSFNFSDNLKGDDSSQLLNFSNDDLSTATPLLSNTKYPKSTFSTQRNTLSKQLKGGDFGSTTLKETASLMDDVINAKHYLRGLETSLE